MELREQARSLVMTRRQTEGTHGTAAARECLPADRRRMEIRAPARRAAKGVSPQTRRRREAQQLRLRRPLAASDARAYRDV